METATREDTRSEIDTQGLGSTPSMDPLDSARAAATEVRRGPGRPKGSGSAKQPATSADEKLADLQRRSKLLEKLYKSENWRQLASMYFDARYALTGYEGFQLLPEEKESLADSMSLMVQVILEIDPKLLVVILFTANFGGMIASKEIQYANSPDRRKRVAGIQSKP